MSLGEGEETAVDIADWIAGRGLLDDIPGIAFRQNGSPHCTAPRRRVRDVDELPRPAWHLFPLENYLANGYGHGVNRGRSMPMLATRGCPYQCTFCSSPDMWTTRYYVRSAAAVVDEISDYVERYQIANVDFEDLTALHQARLDPRLLRRDRAPRPAHHLSAAQRHTFGGARRRGTVGAVRSGCRNLTYAPESGSRRTLQRIKKKVHPERVLESMRVAKKLGVNIKANLMIGFPDETRRDLLDTVIFGLEAAWIGVDDIPLFPFSPYPGTALYEELRRGRALAAAQRRLLRGLGLHGHHAHELGVLGTSALPS